MHPLGSAQFLVTLTLGITGTTLISRFIYLLLKRWPLGIERVALANGASLLLCWILFDIWCSTATTIYWFAGHIAFAPQAAWFIYDILHYDVASAEEAEENAESEIWP